MNLKEGLELAVTRPRYWLQCTKQHLKLHNHHIHPADSFAEDCWVLIVEPFYLLEICESLHGYMYLGKYHWGNTSNGGTVEWRAAARRETNDATQTIAPKRGRVIFFPPPHFRVTKKKEQHTDVQTKQNSLPI